MKTTTRIKTLLAAAFAAVGLSAWAAQYKIGGSNVTWELTEGDTVLTIAGTGDMPDFVMGLAPLGCPWPASKERIKKVTIQSGVTRIGVYAFYGHTGLTSVTISASVTSIGWGAFVNCSGLTEFVVAEGNAAYCSVDGMLFNKDKSEFVCCPGGKTGAVTIPSGVRSIGEWAFAGCRELTEVAIPSDVMSIGNYAFDDCRMTSVTIPEAVTNIGVGAFLNCKELTEVTIPAGVTSIGEKAFCVCPGLTNVFVKGETPSSFGSDVFRGNGKLTAIYVPKTSVDEYKKADGWSDYKDIIKAMVMPDPIVTIENVASVKPWESANGAITVGYSLANVDGLYKVAFDVTAKNETRGVTNDAARLVDGTYTRTIETTDLFGKETIAKDAKVKVSLIAVNPDEIVEATAEAEFWLGPDGLPVGESAWLVQTDVGCYIIGTGVATNLPAAFDRNSVASVVVDDGIKEIGERFFKKCRKLNVVTLGGSVTNVGENAFYLCPSLERIEAMTPAVLESLKDAVVYQTAIRPDGSLYVIPFIDAPGYENVLYGTKELKDPKWERVEAGKTMEESDYHFFKHVLEKVAE